MEYVLGLDLGTSSLKGILMDREGKTIATESSDYPILSIADGFSEQNPLDWWKACKIVFEKLSTTCPSFKQKLVGISFSGQMHSLVTLDKSGEVVRPAILWNDVRTTAQCQRIMDSFSDSLITLTKNKALEGFTLPKILWMQEYEPDNWNRVAHIMLPKDYLIYRLTGELVTDYSDAAGSLLLDVENKEWSHSILEQFNIDLDLLPALKNATDLVGNVSSEIREIFGFEHAIAVFPGGADNACAAIGAGILSSNVGLASIGTSGVFLSFEGDNISDYKGQLHFFNHVLTNNYYSMGVTLSAGHSLSWFKNTFASELTFSEFVDPIKEIPVGSSGLLFTPYIVGERTPHTDSQIRGSFIGIDTKHTRNHFTRAVIEGVTFSLRELKEIMEHEKKDKLSSIVSVGGGAKNKTWLQIQADIFNTTVVSLTKEEGPGAGAAMLAAIGLGWFDTIEDCAEKFVTYNEPVYPIPENVKIYNDIYLAYTKVYGATKPICHMLSGL